jgi:site-specific recombinase XerC
MMISVALERFLVQLDADGRSPHTIGQYRRHVRLLDDWLRAEGHSRRIDRIDHEVVARFLCSPAARCRPDGRTKKATSTNALRTSIRCFFSYLHRAGYIRVDPARLVRRALCFPSPPRALTDDEQKRLLRVLDTSRGEKPGRDAAIVHLLLSTGLRIGSAVALNVEDVDLNAHILWIRSTKGNRPDRVFLGRKITAHLRRWIGDRTTGPLFEAVPGRRITTRHVARRLSQWTARAGIRRPLSPHSLRHSFATRVYARSRDILLVRDALLHRSIASTLVYATHDEQRLREVIRTV